MTLPCEQVNLSVITYSFFEVLKSNTEPITSWIHLLCTVNNGFQIWKSKNELKQIYDFISIAEWDGLHSWKGYNG